MVRSIISQHGLSKGQCLVGMGHERPPAMEWHAVSWEMTTTDHAYFS